MGQFLRSSNLAAGKKKLGGKSREHLQIEAFFPANSNTLSQLQSSHKKEYFEPGKIWEGSSALSLKLGCIQEIHNGL